MDATGRKAKFLKVLDDESLPAELKNAMHDWFVNLDAERQLDILRKMFY